MGEPDFTTPDFIKNSAIDAINQNYNSKIGSLWDIKGWNIELKNEGFCNNLIHASWIHLHWASSPIILNNWRKSVISHSS